MPKIHFDILNQNQKNLLSKLRFLPKRFYLAGGTALALYLGHRTSLDFDFYTKKEFTKSEIIDLLQKYITEKDITVTRLIDRTFNGKIYEVNISIFYYRYSLIKPLHETEYVCLASLPDIIAMKLIAVIQRPAKRDYIDLYYLLKTYSLEQLFNYAKKKYTNFNPYLALRALSYFKDIEKENLEERGIRILDKNFSWKKAEEEIFQKVKQYQLAMLK